MVALVLALLVSAGAVAVSARAFRTATQLGPDPDAAATLRSTDPAERIAALNERLGDVSLALGQIAPVPKVAARIALAWGTLVAIVRLSGDVRVGDPTPVPLVVFAVGASGALACAELARRTSASGEKVRKEWDSLSAALSKEMGLS